MKLVELRRGERLIEIKDNNDKRCKITNTFTSNTWSMKNMNASKAYLTELIMGNFI